MKYKTVIEVVTEAANRDEALEIAGEYLSGRLATGVEMKYRSTRIPSTAVTVVAVTVLSLLLVVGAFALIHIKPTQMTSAYNFGIDAVQPPLKTSPAMVVDPSFKDEWKRIELRQTISSLKESNK